MEFPFKENQNIADKTEVPFDCLSSFLGLLLFSTLLYIFTHTYIYIYTHTYIYIHTRQRQYIYWTRQKLIHDVISSKPALEIKEWKFPFTFLEEELFFITAIAVYRVGTMVRFVTRCRMLHLLRRPVFHNTVAGNCCLHPRGGKSKWIFSVYVITGSC